MAGGGAAMSLEGVICMVLFIVFLWDRVSKAAVDK